MVDRRPLQPLLSLRADDFPFFLSSDSLSVVTLHVTFTDVPTKAVLTHTGWGLGVFVGDYDNDGWEAPFCTYDGKNVLYHNNGDGTFTDVSEKAKVAGNGKAWGTGCAFVDYDRDGKLDLFIANYFDFDLSTAPAPAERPSCMWKGVAVSCRPHAPPRAQNILFPHLCH